MYPSKICRLAVPVMSMRVAGHKHESRRGAGLMLRAQELQDKLRSHSNGVAPYRAARAGSRRVAPHRHPLLVSRNGDFRQQNWGGRRPAGEPEVDPSLPPYTRRRFRRVHPSTLTGLGLHASWVVPWASQLLRNSPGRAPCVPAPRRRNILASNRRSGMLYRTAPAALADRTWKRIKGPVSLERVLCPLRLYGFHHPPSFPRRSPHLASEACSRR